MKNFFIHVINLHVLPRIRLIRNVIKYRHALIIARFGSVGVKPPVRILFVIGCGRSGTSILGEVLEIHPDVRYVFEPIHLWVAIDPRLDFTNLFTDTESAALVDETFFSANAQLRFNKLFFGPEDKLLVEKTPHNALRLGYLERLVPNARYLHIVRCGMEVVESINKLATINASQIAGCGDHNQWWGSSLCKWKALKRDGVKVGFLSDEMDRLTTHRQRAAFEWLLSLKEVERHSQALGCRLLEINYNDLISQSVIVLEKIAIFSDLRRNGEWIIKSLELIKQNQSINKEFDPLILPPGVCELFNNYQNKYGFKRMATPEIDV